MCGFGWVGGGSYFWKCNEPPWVRFAGAGAESYFSQSNEPPDVCVWWGWAGTVTFRNVTNLRAVGVQGRGQKLVIDKK